jgi:N-acetylglutamate synthase
MALFIGELEVIAAKGWRAGRADRGRGSARPPAHGLATAITAALAAAAAALGAPSLYLQVAVGNQAARVLCARAGFTEHHGYHYRVAPAVG